MIRRAGRNGILLLTLGVIGVVLGACAFVQGATAVTLSLGATWSMGWSVLFGERADLASAVSSWPPVLLWFAGGFALFALGWGAVFAGVDALRRGAASQPSCRSGLCEWAGLYAGFCPGA